MNGDGDQREPSSRTNLGFRVLRWLVMALGAITLVTLVFVLGASGYWGLMKGPDEQARYRLESLESRSKALA